MKKQEGKGGARLGNWGCTRNLAHGPNLPGPMAFGPLHGGANKI